MRSWSKWVIFSRRMKSSISVGPRRPALSEFWLSAIGDAHVGRQRLAAGVDAGAVERLVARVVAGRRLAAADLGRRRVLGHRARAVDRIVRLDRLARPAAHGRVEPVLARLQRIGGHRRGGRLGADLLRRQAPLRFGVELGRRRLARSVGVDGPEKVASTVPTLSDRSVARLRPEAGGSSCGCASPWKSWMRGERPGSACRATGRTRVPARPKKSAPKGAFRSGRAAYLPSRSESPGIGALDRVADAIATHRASRAWHDPSVRLELPRALFQSRDEVGLDVVELAAGVLRVRVDAVASRPDRSRRSSRRSRTDATSSCRASTRLRASGRSARRCPCRRGRRRRRRPPRRSRCRPGRRPCRPRRRWRCRRRPRPRPCRPGARRARRSADRGWRWCPWSGDGRSLAINVS